MDRNKDLLKDFEVFLLKLGSLPEDKIKFYIHWVWRFLKFCNYQLDHVNGESISQYLDSLDADEKVADWQVKQAADAVKLYVEKYLKKLLQQPTAVSEDSGENSIDTKESLQWEQVLEEAKNVIRLRHFSLSTEKTYLGWIVRFKTFLKEHNSHLLVNKGKGTINRIFPHLFHR
ncbi:MAG: phage integrase N-terminal SAM-like domain-containing protein, partial [Candidatus Bathycorpusculaceae bacterium]